MLQNEMAQSSAQTKNSSLLGVRLPPDTEIIKYTSGSKKSCKLHLHSLSLKNDFIFAPVFLDLQNFFLANSNHDQLEENSHPHPKRSKMV